MKKLLSLILVLTVIFALAVTAFAADITKAQAEEIALKDAGCAVSDTVYLRSKVDYDDGRAEYDVEFAVENADGSHTEYDYEISADGIILSKDADIERVNSYEDRIELFFRQLINWILSLFK